MNFEMKGEDKKKKLKFLMVTHVLSASFLSSFASSLSLMTVTIIMTMENIKLVVVVAMAVKTN